MKPRWEHDCKRCQYLGTYGSVDMYFCDKQKIGGLTVVARYGSDGPEYTSGIALAKMAPEAEHHMALRVAYLIAKDAGLLTE
jgi:hypothetical protein